MTQQFYQQPYRYPTYNQQMGFKVLPVSSENEINNITVDFNGTPTYFHNQSNNEIYVKQFDIQTGITNVQKFIKSDTPKVEEKKIDYIEKFDLINNRIDELKTMIENITFEKGGKK